VEITLKVVLPGDGLDEREPRISRVLPRKCSRISAGRVRKDSREGESPTRSFEAGEESRE
jgi:hypothetical protein